MYIRSAYPFNGIFGNSGTNSNGTVHPGGMFTEKRYLSRYFLFLAYSTWLFTVILPRKNAKDLKDGGRFPKRSSLQCVSLLVSSVGGRFRTQL